MRRQVLASAYVYTKRSINKPKRNKERQKRNIEKAKINLRVLMGELHVKPQFAFGGQIEPSHHWYSVADVAQGDI